MNVQPSLPKAAFWMVGWLALMLGIMVAGREASRELNVFQVMEVRALIGLVLFYPLVHLAGGLKTVRTQLFGQHLARNLVHYLSQALWLYALMLIPLSQLIAIEFTMPIWTAIMAALFLSEKITPLKALSVALGIAGVIVIVRPSLDHVDPGQAIAFVTAIGFAISVILVKNLTRHDSVVTIIFWMLIIQGTVGLIPALVVWQWPAGETWGWLVVVAICGSFSHYCMARAMTYADATVVVPMDFLRVPLAALVGWLVYSEQIDVYTAAGAALILFGNLLNLRRAGTARVPIPDDPAARARQG
ncbi:MAG: DMT family transporter [Mesorhizobium sp.]